MSNEINANLPKEYWYHIFTYFSLEDRKSIRLTCRSFYDICNDIYFHNKEEIVFHGNINTDYAFNSLADSRRKSWNITMNSVHLVDDAILTCFEKQGANICSLNFYKCAFSQGILKGIIERCEALHSLSLVFPRSRRFYDVKFCENVLTDIKALELSSVVRPNITNFALHVPLNCCLTNRNFIRIFAVFPNIERLDLKLGIGREFNQFSTDLSRVMSEKMFTFSCIYHQITAVADRLEKLALRFDYSKNLRCLSLRTLTKITEIDLKNLKEFSLNWIDLWDRSMPNPFLAFDHLTHFDCVIGCRIKSASDFLLMLLSRFPNLRSLAVTASSFPMDSELFQALIKSQLTTLKLNLKHDIVCIPAFEASFSADPQLRNYTLKHLHVDAKKSKLVLLFCWFFLRLKHLEFFELNDTILRNALVHQQELRSLILHHTQSFESISLKKPIPLKYWLFYDELPRHHLCERLSNLAVIEDTFCLSKFLLKRCVFPQLQSLSIEILLYCKSRNCERIWQAVQKLPQLEYFRLELPTASCFRQWLALCRSLPRLRHFCIVDHSDVLEDWRYRQLFAVCPSLRTVVHHNSSSGFKKFYFDLTTNTVLNVPQRHPWAYRNHHSFICEGIPHYYFQNYKCSL